MQGVFLVATLDAVLIGIVLVLVGVPIALPLIVLTFIAAFFPIIGSVMAGAAATLVALVSGGVVDAAIVLAAIIAIQQLEGNVFYPMVVGKRLQLHPVAILLALTAGGVLAGVAGAFLAIPVAAVDLGGARLHAHAPARGRVRSVLVTPVAWSRMDAAMREYYEQRAPEYDDWWLGTGLFAARERPGWDEDVAALQASLAALAPARTLDVACGTGFLTRHLPGELTGLDQSAGMLEVAARADARTRRSCRATRSTRRSRPAPSSASTPAHFYGHLVAGAADGRSSTLRGAARGRARDHRLRAAPRRRARGLAGARAQRRLAPPRLQALVHGRGARGGARRRRDRARRPVVRRRAPSA